jgi:hypothetical protein
MSTFRESREESLRCQRDITRLRADSVASGVSQQLLSLPLYVGCLVCVGIVLGAGFSSGFTHVETNDILAGFAVLGAALAAINIAVLALVTVWFDDSYQQVLQRRGGWGEAMRPFRIVSTASLVSTAASVVGVFLTAAGESWMKASVLGVVSGLLAWSLMGTLSVVGLIFHHGEERAKLLEQIRELRETMSAN